MFYFNHILLTEFAISMVFPPCFKRYGVRSCNPRLGMLFCRVFSLPASYNVRKKVLLASRKVILRNKNVFFVFFVTKNRFFAACLINP